MVDSPFLMRFLRGWGPLLFLCVTCAHSQHALQSTPSKQVRAAASRRPGNIRNKRHPDVVLITVDTTRADRMGFLGSTRGLTPNLDTLAKDGTAFTRAYSQAPLTPVSHAAILTGTYPQYNHVNDFGAPLAAALPYLPDILHQHGYFTAAFVGSLILDPISGTAPGFDRGFDLYDAGFHMKVPKESRYDATERRAGDVISHALAWLKKRPADAPPFFMWVHLYDPHDPYDPPEPYKSKFSDPYDGEIAYADAMLGRLFTAIRSAGLYDGALVAMMSDHGEAFGEHGERTHGIFLYDETIHVPLLIKLPSASGKSERVPRADSHVGLVDVMPTILESAGFEIPKEAQGQSLLPLIKQPETSSPDRAIYSETDYPHRAFKWSSLRSLRTGKYLVIDAPKPELYNQSSDPKTVDNIASSSPAIAGTLLSEEQKFRQKTAAGLAEVAKLDPEQAEKLRALGYVGGDTGISHEGKIGGTDPKDRIEIANLMHDGMLDVEQGNYQDAVAKLQRVIETEPASAIAYVQLGTAWTRLKDYEKAVPPLEKALALKPDSGMAQYELGLALFETGRWADAAPQFEAVAHRMPRWADAHFSLASVEARIDRVPEAMNELDTALTLNPNHYRANLLRGRILSLQGNAQEGLTNLEKACRVQPSSREAHLFLADAYEQLGRPADAKTQRILAGKAQPPSVP